ncbi:MAG: hypothetical protein Q9226_004266 [Calogaya cf. arnoldii]
MVRLTRWLGARATRTIIFALFIVLFLLHKPVYVSLKGAPTDFSCLFDVSDWPANAQLPEQLVRQHQGSSGLDIDGRYLFVRQLGGGREGAVKLYQDTSTSNLVAIKRFHTLYRNPLPEPIHQALSAEEVNYWPAKIPATILLGGLALRPLDGDPLSKRGLGSENLDMLPALDYFLVRRNTWHSSSLTWHLATPYLGKGTLSHLAENLEVKNQTFNDLDRALRPGLYRLLGSIARLHKLGVCHNDVKPDNIYVEDELHWLLGDLGNVREIEHHYYSTPQWHLEGQWADCQTNDVRRALISYLDLIRRASADTEAFDQQLMCRSSALAQLYWAFKEKPISAEELLHRLEIGQWNAPKERVGECPCLAGNPFWSLREPSTLQMVNSELRWSTVSSRWKFWAS